MQTQIASLPVHRSLYALLIACCFTAANAQVPEKPAGYLTDSGDVITVTEAKLLEARCARIDERHLAQVAIVTIRSLNGHPIEKTALDLFRKWGIGRKGIDDGILLMLSIGDRKSRITIGYGLETSIPDTVSKSILEAMRPDLRAGRYYSALNLALDSLQELLSKSNEAIPSDRVRNWQQVDIR